MKTIDWQIELPIAVNESSIEDALVIQSGIPELRQDVGRDEYIARLKGKRHLILLGYLGGHPVGFKVGYERSRNGEPNSFYSWVGGVVPPARRRGVATTLLADQELWAQSQGFEQIWFKTYPNFMKMILFANINGYEILKNEKDDSIVMAKLLLKS